MTTDGSKTEPPNPVAGLAGLSLIGEGRCPSGGRKFHGISPETGKELEPPYVTATHADVERAAELSRQAARVYGNISAAARSHFLQRIAQRIELNQSAIIDRAHQETGLPLARLQGELGRTTNQLRLFAQVVQDGWWVDARIDDADPGRKPVPKPDVRSMLHPLGPVAVFGASNFPLAFSVAGGDTASALAAGCPVVVKAHPAHPGTSELVGRELQQAVKECDLPEGVFSLLFDADIEVGAELVRHSAIKAVAFTGSAEGGKALMHLASARQEPIPCFCEMSSSNPLFLLPESLEKDPQGEAKGLLASFVLSSGQFCTKPGLVFVPENPATDTFLEVLRNGIMQMAPLVMLTPRIAERYRRGVEERASQTSCSTIARSTGGIAVHQVSSEVALLSASLEDFLRDSTLSEEIFGPATLVVYYREIGDLVKAAATLEGHLTATVHGSEHEMIHASELIETLRSKVGRLLFKGYPTGVEVCHAMVHGGPYPATSDSRSTSVGTRAITRFARPICYQDSPDWLLPIELQRANPRGIARLVNGTWTTSPQPSATA